MPRGLVVIRSYMSGVEEANYCTTVWARVTTRRKRRAKTASRTTQTSRNSATSSSYLECALSFARVTVWSPLGTETMCGAIEALRVMIDSGEDVNVADPPSSPQPCTGRRSTTTIYDWVTIPRAMH